MLLLLVVSAWICVQLSWNAGVWGARAMRKLWTEARNEETAPSRRTQNATEKSYPQAIQAVMHIFRTTRAELHARRCDFFAALTI